LADCHQLQGSFTRKWCPDLKTIAGPSPSHVKVSLNTDSPMTKFRNVSRDENNKLKIIFERILDDPIVLVNVGVDKDSRISWEQFDLEYVPVALVQTSSSLRKNKDYCHISTLMYNSSDSMGDQIMYDTVVINRDNEYSAISFEEYKTHASEFKICQIALVRKGMPELLREYKRTGNIDPDFVQKIPVLRVCGADESSIYVEDVAVSSHKNNKTGRFWFQTAKLNACLIVLSIAMDRGFCPWHPHSDPTSAIYCNDKVLFHFFVEFSLCGETRYNGPVGGNSKAKCMYIGCINRSQWNGMCVSCLNQSFPSQSNLVELPPQSNLVQLPPQSNLVQLPPQSNLVELSPQESNLVVVEL